MTRHRAPHPRRTRAVARSPVGGCPADSGTDTIVLSVPKVTLTIAGAGEDNDATGDLDLTGGTVSIEGQLAWSGALAGKALTPGVYRLQARANSNGLTGPTVSHTFTVERG